MAGQPVGFAGTGASYPFRRAFLTPQRVTQTSEHAQTFSQASDCVTRCLREGDCNGLYTPKPGLERRPLAAKALYQILQWLA